MTVYAEYQASLPIHCISSCATKTNKQRDEKNLFSTVFLGENAHEHILVVWRLSPCLRSQDKLPHLQRLNIVTAIAGL